MAVHGKERVVVSLTTSIHCALRTLRGLAIAEDVHVFRISLWQESAACALDVLALRAMVLERCAVHVLMVSFCFWVPRSSPGGDVSPSIRVANMFQSFPLCRNLLHLNLFEHGQHRKTMV